MTPSPYGTHRVIEPAHVLPQAAWRIDNRPDIAENEILLAVDTLNVDSASFAQLKEQAGGDPAAVGLLIQDIVTRRGKLHNPVTGSGGMLLGRVARVGPALAHRGLQSGEPVATLVSLSLTPLDLYEILQVDLHADQVRVRGHAVLFETGLYARMPADLPQQLVLSVLDVCGAPAQTAHLARPGMTVLVLGAGGKSGLMCSHAARRQVGVTGRVIALDYGEPALARARRLGVSDAYVQVDATRPLDVLQAVEAATGGARADLTLVCVNVPGAEMGAILATRPTGTVYFFSMATSFTAAALGAEGVGSPVTMIIGNGYTPGHAEMALQIMRESPALRELFSGLTASN